MNFLQKLFAKSKKPTKPYCSALIAAAGSSNRMGGENKLLLPLCGKPVIVHTLLAIDRSELVDEIIIATREEDLLTYADLCKTHGITKPVKVVIGGASREESVLRAAMEANEQATLLAVQDGARPMVTSELIDKVIKKARECNAAAPAIPVHDTIKVATDGIVMSTPDRSTLYAVQTPQVFDAQLLRAALQSAVDNHALITDDCSAVERLGKQVYLTEGSQDNFKITTPLDMILAQAIMERRGE